MTEPASLHIHQLVELLAVVSSFTGQASAMQGAVERSAQALEAEVAAVLLGERVAASIGFPAGQVPEADLVAVAQRRQQWLSIPGVGRCPVATASWGGSHPGHLVLARWGDGFSIEEQNLVRGMARLLELTLTMLRTLQAEHEMRERSDQQVAVNRQLVTELREHQRLLEHLFEIQRAISRRQPLQQILDTITTAAHDLLRDDIVGLWLLDDADPERAWLRSMVGLDAEQARQHPPVPLTEAGAAGTAMLVDGIVAFHGEADASPVIGQFAGGPVYASMAAPVHIGGAVKGALLIASRRPRRVFNDSDEQTLQAFAGHVSLALTDAATVNRMHLAFHDALTGLASRGLFLERLGERLARAQRSGAPVALLFLDIDRFKGVNDALGHSVGDQVLMATAERVRHALRAEDTAARFGGDEFAVMLPGVGGAADAVAVAERILAQMAEPMLVSRHQLWVTASIGIALSAPGQADPADLIRHADIAMYQAKRNGRGRAELFAPAMVEALPDTAPSVAG
jgi:diguanylate cyclase (GGDEF)-like protein